MKILPLGFRQDFTFEFFGQYNLYLGQNILTYAPLTSSWR